MHFKVVMKKLLVCAILFACIRSERLRRTRLLSREERDSICTSKNGYYPVVGQCDAYFECQNWKATSVKFCPDGLRFQPGTIFPEFPCLYPVDVSCEGRSMVQVADPTPDCPNRYGFYPGDDREDCGLYKSCVDGRAYHMRCPEGLAFNPENYQCEWPDKVKSCVVETYLGFSCPGLFSDDVTSSVSVNYPHPKDCRRFYSCVGGKPRVVSCPEKQAFDEDSGLCKNEEDVFCVLV